MKKLRKKHKILLALLIIAVIAVTAIAAMNIASTKRANEVGKMNSIEAIRDYCSGKDNIVLTVGVINEGKTGCILYGKNGTILPQYEHPYEIGSVTKTFTTSLLCKALNDGKIKLDDSIAKYIELKGGQHYPTIKQLATHTSGYEEVPFSVRFKSIISSFTDHNNFFSGYNTQSLINDIQSKNLPDKEYKWEYSNFGMAVLGHVLSQVYKSDYKTLVEDYAQKELGLANTHVRTGKMDLSGYTSGNKTANWEWKSGDAFMPAGSLVSTTGDMLKYAQIQVSKDMEYLSLGYKKYAETSNPGYGMGLGWILDEKDNTVWCNGETYGFNSYIGFDRGKKIIAVVMSNYAGQGDNNSTIIGQKIMQELHEGNNLVFKN